jgi:hypothetical protein
MSCRTLLALAVLLLPLLVGCGPSGPEIAYVSGKVTLDGQPLPYASIIFIPENGRPAGAATDENGNYVLNFDDDRQGTMPGKNSVRITTQRDPYEDKSGKQIPGSKELVPARYNSNSTLEFDVQPRTKNVANFDLESKGPITPSN